MTKADKLWKYLHTDISRNDFLTIVSTIVGGVRTFNKDTDALSVVHENLSKFSDADVETIFQILEQKGITIE